MAQTSCIILAPDDRERLVAIITDRNRPQKHVLRTRIILHSDERLPVQEVARRAGVSRPAVWRWQQRFAEEGVEGLLRDKTRPPGKAPLPAETVAQVLSIPCSEPPGETTHWTGRAVAQIVGISRSNDPAFAEKVEDIVGLSMSPPTHAVVLSIDEKSQIQALSRTRPGMPVRPGRPATMTHDYERQGTTTLFAALNVLDGTVLGRCMQRHRHQAHGPEQVAFDHERIEPGHAMLRVDPAEHDDALDGREGVGHGVLRCLTARWCRACAGSG